MPRSSAPSDSRTRRAVLGVVRNGLTTIAGFGSLLVADHRGVWSLGLLLVIGSTMTLAASLVVLPALVRLGSPRRRAVAQEPVATFPVAAAARPDGSRPAGRRGWSARRPAIDNR